MSVAQLLAEGNPQDRRDNLLERVQADALTMFSSVSEEWLALMWCLDAYRIADVVPPGMLNRKGTGPISGEALNKRKGNWFADVVTALLQNRTSQPLGGRTRIQGFSQTHQIDIGWPNRKIDPLVCIETKVMGAPGTKDKPPRAASADWTNRRKEIKFSATDLKLYRRQQDRPINHWDEWRQSAPPKAYLLLAVRLDPDKDKLVTVMSEARALIESYMDGVGVFAWEEAEEGYRSVSLAPKDRVLTIDDVLMRIGTEIKNQLDPSGSPPEPFEPKL